ncbi:hypothetical protein CPB84DRAFT_1842339 [Gymnopilus junonius]|uniref:RlpA-like double-psi beta-barrel-protein domain-containing protein-containing protein n=1 Tax=Gymnopilus junonius TaxID=109634 RepID=A0A9P5NW13_GYMJU|nr:hypothetical protein CPB84DRAFT_1842339 [Gymnopilus junonius]
MLKALSTLVSFALLFSTVTPSLASSFHSRPRAVHYALAKRAVTDMQLYKRFSNTRWTFYDVGLGACGAMSAPSDWIVALNSIQFGPGYPGQHCFKNIVMSYNGKTATATIVDSCPGCPYGGLDLSRGLFSYFADQDTGVISGEWSFADVATPQAPPDPTPPNTMDPIVTSAFHAADAIFTKTAKTKKKKTKIHTRTGTGNHTHSDIISTPWQVAAATVAPTSKKTQVHPTASSSTSRPALITPSATSSSTTATNGALVAPSSSRYTSVHYKTEAFTGFPPSNPTAATRNTSATSSTKSTGENYSGNTTAAFGGADPTAEIESNIQAISALLLRLGELIAAGAFLGRHDK